MISGYQDKKTSVVSVLLIITPKIIYLGLAGIAVLGIYYLLQSQIASRRQVEITLRQQTERERLINQIAQNIRQSLKLGEVLTTTVADVRQFLLTDRVLIYRLNDDGTGSAITESVLPEYPAILGQTFPPEVFPPEYHQAYIQGKIRAIADVNREDVEPCLVEFLAQFRVQAKLVVPIIQQFREQDSSTPHLWGLLIAHHCRSQRQIGRAHV